MWVFDSSSKSNNPRHGTQEACTTNVSLTFVEDVSERNLHAMERPKTVRQLWVDLSSL